MLTLADLRIFLDDVWVRFRKHIANESAHHEKYTDAEAQELIDTHAGLPSVHHTKYTDAEAVIAADASDKFVERNVTNLVTHTTRLKCAGPVDFMEFKSEQAAGVFAGTFMTTALRSTGTTFLWCHVNAAFPNVQLEGTDVAKTIGSFWFRKNMLSQSSSISLLCLDSGGALKESIEVFGDKIDVKNFPIKNIKNHADATLSGTPRVVELLIGATPYYFKVYPTKT